MIRNLLSLYPESIISDSSPVSNDSSFYTFYDKTVNEWISIPQSSITQKELSVLKLLFMPEEKPLWEANSPFHKKWLDFLLSNGELPVSNTDQIVRLIQIEFNGETHNKAELESAIEGFFSEKILILWERENKAVVIEESVHPLEEKELASMPDALESDFYIKTTIYIGKQYLLSNSLPHSFKLERGYFDFAKKVFTKERSYTFEKVFPGYLAANMPDFLAEALKKKFQEVFSDDEEMFTTIKVFLEHNSNASSAAKKLYIHRNTLQYRIDKFSEKTRVNLKDFHSSFTVYLACLLHEHSRR